MSTLKEICKEQTELLNECRQNINELTEENDRLERKNNNLKQSVSEYKYYAKGHVASYLEMRALEHENEQLKKKRKK